MLAPKVAAGTKAGAVQTSLPARRELSAAKQKVGGEPQPEATPGVSWDFSRISGFPPEPPGSQVAGAEHRGLTIGRVDDPLEHEADRLADQVMETPSFISSAPPQLSRKAATGAEAPATAHKVLGTPGHRLDASERMFFEPRFRRDLQSVRIHDDAQAAQSAREVGALAYTVGEHVVVDPARYRPGTVEGRHLLAHELAHVSQAGATAVLRRQPTNPPAPTPPPGNQTTADPQPVKVKPLVQQKDPTPTRELWALLSANALDNKPAPAAGPITPAGAAHVTHKWTLRVELKANLGIQGTVRGKTDPETVSTAAGTTTHDIHIAINKFLGSSPEELAAHPDLQERMNYMAAETLLHELIHARLEIDKSLASLGVAPTSAVGTQLQSLQAKRVAAAAEETDLKSKVGSLIGAASAAVGSPILSPANTVNFVNEEVNHLVEEKFAKQTAGMAFGLGASIANAQISSAYGDQLAKSVIELAMNVDFRKGDALKTQRQWDNYVDFVKASIKAFYDKLDAPAAPATPGTQPQPAPSPSAPPQHP